MLCNIHSEPSVKRLFIDIDPNVRFEVNSINDICEVVQASDAQLELLSILEQLEHER